MADTPNHEYNVPDQGDQDWHQPLNENFEEFEVDIELRDQESNLGDYDPSNGAKFLATDTGVVYLGDGTDWNATFLAASYDDLTGEATISGTLVTSKLDVGSISGSLTGGTELSNIAGSNLSIDSNGQLNASGGGGGGGGGNWTANNNLLEPSDSNIDGIDVDEVRTPLLAATSGPLTLTVDGAQALELTGESGGDAGNVVAGHSANTAAGVAGATIAGGGFDDGILNEANEVTADYGTVGGGSLNAATGNGATVSGGSDNEASGRTAAVGGGFGNAADGESATIAGGRLNEAAAKYGTIAGGGPGDESNPENTNNVVYGEYGTIAGGGNNQAGSDDGDPTTATFATVAGGEENEASDEFATVGGGASNEASNSRATVSGGLSNEATAVHATIGGGGYNEASEIATTVGGGTFNKARGQGATVGGGFSNEANGKHTTIAGGGPSEENNTDSTKNIVYDNYGTIGGGGNNQAGSDDGDPTTATYATVGGGEKNEASNIWATVSGGLSNEATATYATIGGGGANEASESFTTVGGGTVNKARGLGATVGGGLVNEANGRHTTIAGGGPSDENNTGNTNNIVYDNYGTIGGGGNNQAGSDDGDPTTATFATVAGGEENVASAQHATVLGGQENEASGNFSIALGRNATASDPGSLVVGDSTSNSVESVAGNQARFQGSIRSGLLTTESGVLYYPSDADTIAEWRTRYDTSNDFWRVDQWTGVSWSDRMWVNSNGDVKATGSKDFVETVETDEGEKKVHYSATESGTPHTEESGVGKLDDGRAEIALPDHFEMVTDGDEPLVVQTTPYGGSSGLKVVERSTDRLVVEDLDGEGDYEFAYTVKGTRDGYADKEVVREPSASAESPQSPTPADD